MMSILPSMYTAIWATFSFATMHCTPRVLPQLELTGFARVSGVRCDACAAEVVVHFRADSTVQAWVGRTEVDI